MKPHALAFIFLTGLPSVAHAESWAWLSLGSKMPKNTKLELTGVDSAQASATARIERDDAHDHCANFSPSNVESCTEGLIAEEAGRLYTAWADCVAGTITTVYDRQFEFAGYWQGDWATGLEKYRGPHRSHGFRLGWPGHQPAVGSALPQRQSDGAT